MPADLVVAVDIPSASPNDKLGPYKAWMTVEQAQSLRDELDALLARVSGVTNG